MLKVGLTGGIGSGKSTVAALFQALNVPVIDADQIARQLVEPGQPALAQIRAQWGDTICHADGSLNRGKLRETIFSDSEQKARLEAILHPLIFQTIEQRVAVLSGVYCLIDIPLLLETGQQAQVDRILVVDCPLETQIERVMQRNSLSYQQVAAIIANQANREYRLSCADDVIDNAKTPPCLAEQVKNLHNLYLFLGNSRAFSI